MRKTIFKSRRKRLFIALVLVLIGLFSTALYFGIHKKAVPVKLTGVMSQLPVYPGSSLKYSVTIPDKTVQGKGERYQAVWESSTQTPEISKWYQEKLARLGWTIDVPPADITQPVQLVVFKKDINTINLSLIREKETKVSEITLDYLPGLVTEGEGE